MKTIQELEAELTLARLENERKDKALEYISSFTHDTEDDILMHVYRKAQQALSPVPAAQQGVDLTGLIKIGAERQGIKSKLHPAPAEEVKQMLADGGATVDYKWHLEQLSTQAHRIAELEKDRERLGFVLKVVADKGSKGISDLVWTQVEIDGEETDDFIFDRTAIDTALTAIKNEVKV